MATRQKSLIWNYFCKAENEKALCNICKQAFSYKTSMTNLKGHLQRKHVSVYTELISRTVEYAELVSTTVGETINNWEEIVDVPTSNESTCSIQVLPCFKIMPYRQRSIIWKYFSKTENEKASCNVCKKAISYKSSVTNLKGHLQRKHVSVYTELISLTAGETINNPEEIIDVPTSNASILPVLSSPTTEYENPQPVKKRKSMGSHVSKSIAPKKKKLIDRDLLDLIILGLQPFSIVEDASFSKLMRWIPGYELPSRETISSDMIPALYYKTIDTVKESVFKEAKTICITTDLWTSCVNESYLSITGHYITNNFEFKTILIKCSSLPVNHTAVHLSESIKEIITDWNIENKINFSVSNNASNIANALEDILQLKHYGCYGHSLNLIVQESLKVILPVTEKIKNIVGHFKRSCSANEELLKYQLSTGCSQPKQLINDVATRWNSTFYMLKRFVELEEAIKATITSLDKDLPVITVEEWEICKQICEILSPFEEMTKSMSGEKYMTGSSVIVITRCLIGTCEKLEENDYYDAAKNVIKSLKSGLNERFNKIEQNDTFALCTLLDPRYKSHVFQDQSELEEAKEKLRYLVVQLIENDSKTSCSPVTHRPSTSKSVVNRTPLRSSISAWGILNKIIADKHLQTNNTTEIAIKEIDSYMNEDILPRINDDDENNCPLSWWDMHQHIYPNLAELYRTRCNIVATSVPCERLFSKAGNLLSERQTQLPSKNIEMIMFLNGNSEMIKE